MMYNLRSAFTPTMLLRWNNLELMLCGKPIFLWRHCYQIGRIPERICIVDTQSSVLIRLYLMQDNPCDIDIRMELLVANKSAMFNTRL